MELKLQAASETEIIVYTLILAEDCTSSVADHFPFRGINRYLMRFERIVSVSVCSGATDCVCAAIKLNDFLMDCEISINCFVPLCNIM